MRHLKYFTPLLLCVVVGTTGCKKVTRLLAEKGLNAVSNSETTVAPLEGETQANEGVDPEVLADHQLGMKLNAYIECLNGASSRAHDAIERYESWVGSKDGPTGKERIVYGIYEVHDVLASNCEKSLAKAAQMEPKLPAIEQVGEKYGAALKDLTPILTQAYQYYDAKRYTGDDFAEGKKLHAPLMTAYEAFDKADEALRDEIDLLRSGMADRELSQIEKKFGKNLMYYGRKLVFDAKKVIEASDAATDADLKALSEVFPAYAETVKGMQERALSAEGKQEQPMNYTFLASAATKFEASMRRRLLLLEGKEKFSQGDNMMIKAGSGKMIEGHPEQVVEAFNGLIEASNGTSW